MFVWSLCCIVYLPVCPVYAKLDCVYSRKTPRIFSLIWWFSVWFWIQRNFSPVKVYCVLMWKNFKAILSWLSMLIVEWSVPYWFVSACPDHLDIKAHIIQRWCGSLWSELIHNIASWWKKSHPNYLRDLAHVKDVACHLFIISCDGFHSLLSIAVILPLSALAGDVFKDQVAVVLFQSVISQLLKIVI